MKMKYFFTGLAALWLVSNLHAQGSFGEKDPVLFTYGNHSVSKSEFEYVFQKNNPEIGQPALEDLRNYLDLYIKFKLKVAAAEDARLDTVEAVRNDLKTYLDQLYRSYYDKLVLEPLMKEVEQRWMTDVRGSHILVRLKKNATPEDTLRAYRHIMEIRKRILAGEDFEAVAREESEDEYVKFNGGDIGYVAVLALPFYSFENALYKTEVGRVSMPVRTSLGYHLVMPTEKRPAMGNVTVAHILIKADANAGEEEWRAAREKAHVIYEKLKAGEDFGTLAAKFSDDEATRSKGGEMQAFGTGQMVAEFEKAAYSLKEDSSFTEPFRSRYGYHILMLLNKKDKPAFGDHEARIKRQIKKDERYRIAKERTLERLKKDYAFKSLNPSLEQIVSRLDSSVYFGKYKVPLFEEQENSALFEIDGRIYRMRDLLKYIELNQRYARNKSLETIVKEAYEAFIEHALMERAFADHFPEYARLKQEYRDGIMMFAMMQDSVWNKALADSAGLEDYYERHKDQYWWKERAEIDIYHILDPEAVPVKKLKKLARKKSRQEILETFNDSSHVVLRIESETVEKGEPSVLKEEMWKSGWYALNEGGEGEELTLVHVKKILDPSPKTLDEARGIYIADFQNELEARWIERLKKRYPVKVNEAVLKSIVKKH